MGGISDHSRSLISISTRPFTLATRPRLPRWQSPLNRLTWWLLKVKPQRELYDSTAPISGGLPERTIDLLPGSVKPCCVVYSRPLRMVERVVELTTKLKFDVLMNR